MLKTKIDVTIKSTSITGCCCKNARSFTIFCCCMATENNLKVIHKALLLFFKFYLCNKLCIKDSSAGQNELPITALEFAAEIKDTALCAKIFPQAHKDNTCSLSSNKIHEIYFSIE
jgi:hypothetical protein